MTKEELKKEAEKYVIKKHHIDKTKLPIDFSLSCEFSDGFTDFQNGAEFGYNKAFVEADKNLKAIVTDFNKANEWHRVSDKLPEMDVPVYLWKKGKDFPVVACRHFPYGKKEWVWNCEWGSGFTISQLKGRDFLWKEIVLPKEITE